MLSDEEIVGLAIPISIFLFLSIMLTIVIAPEKNDLQMKITEVNHTENNTLIEIVLSNQSDHKSINIKNMCPAKLKNTKDQDTISITILPKKQINDKDILKNLNTSYGTPYEIANNKSFTIVFPKISTANSLRLDFTMRIGNRLYETYTYSQIIN